MAGGISDDDLRKVREASDLVSIVGERVPVKQRGRDFWCCCPFHQEKTPSCKIDPHSQLWHCFGCGEGGDVFTFVMKLDGLSFPDAVRSLAQRAGIELSDSGGPRVPDSKKARLKEVCAAAAEFYHLQLMRSPASEAAAARSYLANRGFGGEVPKRWNLGFAPGSGSLVRHLSAKRIPVSDMIEANVALKGRDGRARDRFYNRVMFPICDQTGECIAFGGRVVGSGEPKYLNSQETPLFHKSQVLYGLDKAKADMTATGVAIITEGYTDVIALHEAGVRNAVATLGTALTMSHIRIISRHAKKRIVYLFDGDAAGQRAADRALEFIDESMTPEAGRTRIELCAVTLPNDQDPAEFVAAHGADALRELVAGAVPLLTYGIERRLSRHDLATAEGRTRALTDALSVLAPIKNSLLAKDYAHQIADRCRAREEDALAMLARLRPPVRAEREEPLQAQGGAAQPDPHAGAAPSAPGSPAQIGQAESNRRRVERDFLCLCVRAPYLALAKADTLVQTRWHLPVHETLARSIADTLAARPSASSGEIVTAATAVEQRAARILTASSAREGVDDAALADYLAEELVIGDMEDAIEGLRAELSGATALSADERDLLFQSVVASQKQLRALKAAHKPPVS